MLIQDGKIESIALRRLTTDGDEVDYEEWTGVEVDGRLRPNLKQYREDVAQAMIEKQNYEVDGIAGATVTVNNWKLAVRRALEEAQENQ